MTKNNFINWIRINVCILLSLLIICIGSVIYIDPFFVYHKPIKHFTYVYDDAMYQCAGMVKNFDYEILIAGTSLVQNMKMSTVKEVFKADAIKTPLCGISFKRIVNMIELALNNNPNLKTVILPIYRDLFSYSIEDDDPNFPDYLYDNNILNDVNYVLNKDVFLHHNINTIFNPKNLPQETLDSIYSSEKQFYFAEFTALARKETHWNWDIPHYYENLEENIDLLQNLVELYPQIQFEFFIPPKSIIYLEDAVENNLLDTEIDFLRTIVSSLFERNYDNVNIHIFQDDINIIGNLYNYCDSIHFSSNVSDTILRDIKSQKRILTKESYIKKLENIKVIAETFDYSILYPDSFPLKAENNINNYLNMINEDKYEIYVSYLHSDKLSVSDATKKLFKAKNIDVNKIIKTATGSFNQKITNKDNHIVFGSNGSILINNIDYSMGLPGLNIVIYDKELQRVVDSVNFNGFQLNDCLRTKNVRKNIVE